MHRSTDPRIARRLRLVLTLVTCAWWATGAASDHALTFADAQRLAAQAPTVRLAERALDLARRQLAVTGVPVRGELGGGYRWTTGERDLGAAGVVDLGDTGFDPVTLTLAFPTVGIGPGADALARAHADVERAVAELAAARRGARLDAAQGFQRALRARHALTLAVADRTLAELELAAAALRRVAGAASTADLSRLALALDRAHAAVAAAEHEVTAADRLLAVTLGAAVGPPVGPLPDPLAWIADAEAAWERRTDVLNARLQADDTNRLAGSALRDNLPSASLSFAAAFSDADRSLQFGAGFDTRTLQPSANLSFDPDSGGPGLPADGQSRSFTVAIGLRVPLYPAVGDAIVAASIGRERAAALLELTRARAEIDVEQRRIDLESAAANADLAHAGAELAAADLELARLRFAGGHLAELALRRADIDAARARLDAERASDTTRLAALRLLDALAVDPADWE